MQTINKRPLTPTEISSLTGWLHHDGMGLFLLCIESDIIEHSNDATESVRAQPEAQLVNAPTQATSSNLFAIARRAMCLAIIQDFRRSFEQKLSTKQTVEVVESVKPKTH